MKKILFLFVLGPLVLILSSSYKEIHRRQRDSVLQDTLATYRDGIWEGISRASYTEEPYWGIARMTIKGGRVTGISFMIRDSALHETFDAKYEKHFEGNPDFIEQSRNDWKGVQNYPGRLLEYQDIKKVDAMSGATWSYDIFRAAVEDALKKAK
jgi:major membrane immunogen (membrane-anchored lipoprotein)